jgi:hypothetical protein
MPPQWLYIMLTYWPRDIFLWGCIHDALDLGKIVNWPLKVRKKNAMDKYFPSALPHGKALVGCLPVRLFRIMTALGLVA